MNQSDRYQWIFVNRRINNIFDRLENRKRKFVVLSTDQKELYHLEFVVLKFRTYSTTFKYIQIKL